MRNEILATALVILVAGSLGIGYLVGNINQLTTTTVTITTTVYSSLTTSVNSQTSIDTTFTTNFYWYISINYSGSWNLVYWGYNGTATNYNVKGSLNGSGNYQTTVVTYGVGYVENTLCAKATKLDSRNLALNLTVLGNTNSTTASNPSAEVCGTYAV